MISNVLNLSSIQILPFLLSLGWLSKSSYNFAFSSLSSLLGVTTSSFGLVCVGKSMLSIGKKSFEWFSSLVGVSTGLMLLPLGWKYLMTESLSESWNWSMSSSFASGSYATFNWRALVRLRFYLSSYFWAFTLSSIFRYFRFYRSILLASFSCEFCNFC